MTEEEVAAVLGHEVAHVANGDMITLTLIQGVVNTFVIFFARIVGYFVDRVVLKNDRGVGAGYYITVIVCEIVFGVLASVIVAWRSEEHTSELQSLMRISYAVFCLNKKKTNKMR